MNAAHQDDPELLEHTLAEVRRVRRQRTVRKFAVLPLLLATGFGWLALTGNRSAAPVPQVETPPAAAISEESLTVVEWKGGTPSLVEYSGEELGKLELSFSLEPVVAFPEEIW
jgi:hypothetical protein